MFFFDLRRNKRLSKQPWGWWFKTPSWSLWRQCNEQNVLLTLTSMCLYIYMHIDPYVSYISVCICICVIFILFNWFHYLCPRRTWSLALYFGKQYCTKMLHCYLFSLHPLLTTIYCEIDIRAHKPRLPALIAMKECYQFFSKRCTLYLLPEHVKMLHWLHVCCFVYWMETM